jgi:hypothetical protein
MLKLTNEQKDLAARLHKAGVRPCDWPVPAAPGEPSPVSAAWVWSTAHGYVYKAKTVCGGLTLAQYTEWCADEARPPLPGWTSPAATAPVVGQLGSTEELGVVRYVGYDDTCRSWVWYVEDTEAYVPLAPGEVCQLHPVDMLDRAFRAHGHTVRGLAQLIIDNKVPGVKYEA